MLKESKRELLVFAAHWIIGFGDMPYKLSAALTWSSHFPHLTDIISSLHC